MGSWKASLRSLATMVRSSWELLLPSSEFPWSEEYFGSSAAEKQWGRLSSVEKANQSATPDVIGPKSQMKGSNNILIRESPHEVSLQKSVAMSRVGQVTQKDLRANMNPFQGPSTQREWEEFTFLWLRECAVRRWRRARGVLGAECMGIFTSMCGSVLRSALREGQRTSHYHWCLSCLGMRVGDCVVGGWFVELVAQSWFLLSTVEVVPVEALQITILRHWAMQVCVYLGLKRQINMTKLCKDLVVNLCCCSLSGFQKSRKLFLWKSDF